MKLLQALEDALRTRNPHWTGKDGVSLMRRLLSEKCSLLAQHLVHVTVDVDNVNTVDLNCETLFVHACTYGDTVVAELLIEKGARYSNETLLRANCPEDFILRHFDFSQKSDKNVFTIFAFQFGYPQLLRRLFDAGYAYPSNILNITIYRDKCVEAMEDVCLHIARSGKIVHDSTSIQTAIRNGFSRSAEYLKSISSDTEETMIVAQYSPR